MNSKKLHLLGQCIVNRTLGKDVKVNIASSWSMSCVALTTKSDNTNTAHEFIFGCIIQDDRSLEIHKIICKAYPIAKTVEPMLFAMLHEIGHVFFTGQASRTTGYSKEEYRELPQEKFADTWAANFIKKNKLIVQLWNKQIKEAL